MAQQPHGERFSTSSASSSVQLLQHAGIFGALDYFLALVVLGLAVKEHRPAIGDLRRQLTADRIPYVDRLRFSCLGHDGNLTDLDKVPVPSMHLVVQGPASVINMFELAVKKAQKLAVTSPLVRTESVTTTPRCFYTSVFCPISMCLWRTSLCLVVHQQERVYAILGSRMLRARCSWASAVALSRRDGSLHTNSLRNVGTSWWCTCRMASS